MPTATASSGNSAPAAWPWCTRADLKHDRDVAIKVLRPESAAALGAERFLAEATTARLDHPNILTLIDSGDVDGTLFDVMPFVRGESSAPS